MSIVRNILTLILCAVLFSQSSAQNYSRVQMNFSDDQEKADFFRLSIAADHGIWRGTDRFETDLRQDEVDMVRAAGLNVTVLIEDVSAFYEKRLRETAGQPKAAAASCDGQEIAVPSEFSLGSMGGYLTYSEFLAHLDNMRSLYPDLITAKQPVGSFETVDQHPMYWVRISDNPDQDETEPEVLYTALHHAREPASLSQLIFYMYYLLENYNSDPAIKELVDNTEMYFIPMVNPDGYIYNQTTNPNGGGMWRKNRRDNGSGVYGVDLNRNYSYEWGVSGASTNPNNETYQGTSSMSEQETQAMEYFMQQHEIVTALNFHTYADQLLFPWGYADNVQTPDHDKYTAISAEMVSQNGYLNQQSSLLYPAAGDSDDWGYGETGTKPRVYSMTCEVGGDNDGFWPAQNRIIPLCQENVYLNLTLARSATNYARLTDLEPAVQTSSGSLSYGIQRLGWQSGSFTVSIEPLQNIASVGAANTHAGMTMGQSLEDSIAFTLTSGIQSGDPIVYVLQVDNGLYVSRDTITKMFGPGISVFANDGDPLSDWNLNNSWGLTTSDFVTSPNSLADSPTGDYSNNSNRILETVQPIALTDLSNAYLRFYAKWDIEAGYDFAQVSASTDGSNWIPLCGNFTVLGNGNQDEGEPIYDGVQDTWVREEMGLSDFLGESVYLQFRLVSDQYVTGDGIYIDDVEVTGIADVSVSSTQEQDDSPLLVYPNPATESFAINLKVKADVAVFDSEGRSVLEAQMNSGRSQMDISHWAVGLYLLRAKTANGFYVQRLSVR